MRRSMSREGLDIAVALLLLPIRLTVKMNFM